MYVFALWSLKVVGVLGAEWPECIREGMWRLAPTPAYHTHGMLQSNIGWIFRVLIVIGM